MLFKYFILAQKFNEFIVISAQKDGKENTGDFPNHWC